MYCKDCGHILDSNGVCPICGYRNTPANFDAPDTQTNNSAPYEQNPPYQNQMNPYNSQQYGQNMNYGNPNSAQQYGQNMNYGNPNSAQQYGQNVNYGNPNSAQQYGQNVNYGNPNSAQQYGQNVNYGNPNSAQQYGQNVNYSNPYGAQYSQQYGQTSPTRQNIPAQQPRNVAAKSKRPMIFGIAGGLIAVIAIVLVIVIRTPEKQRNTTENTEMSTTEQPTTDTAEPSTEQITPVADSGTRTVMMYIVGSNLESDHGAASEDIDEILNAGFNEEKVNFLIYTGGCNDWDNPAIQDEGNTTLLVQDGALVELSHEDERNMGDASTLTDFLTYGYENYPAEQYSLILWNHGGGSFFGFGYDERTDDSLSLAELSDALNASPFNSEMPLEWIGFDACLMASIETADILSPYARYLVASQESEPSWGWDYSFLSELDTMPDGAAVGTKIADTYIDTTEQNFSMTLFSYSDITMSVMDLSQMDNVEAAIDDLFSKADASLNDATYTKYSRIRSGTKEIASEFTGESSYDVVDLMDLAQQMKSEFLSEATALENALSDFIVYSNANVAKANGVSIYYPYNAKSASGYYIPMYYEFGFASGYADYIKNFAMLLTGDSVLTAEWDIDSMIPVANGDMTFTLQLTDEQAADCQNAYYVISRADVEQPGNYVFVAMSNQVEMTESNALTADFDGQLIYMQNDTTFQQYEVMYTEQESTADYTRYLLTSILFNDTIEDEDAMYAYFVLETTPDNPQGTIMGAYPIENLIVSNGNDLFPDRYEIDINDYQNIAFGAASHQFTSTEDLNNFNEADWSDVSIWYNSLPISDGFSTTLGGMVPGVPYFGMFIIEDSQGNRHCSNLVQLQ